jgi:predicted XRE-type DNA-binding protein
MKTNKTPGARAPSKLDDAIEYLLQHHATVTQTDAGILFCVPQSSISRRLAKSRKPKRGDSKSLRAVKWILAGHDRSQRAAADMFGISQCAVSYAMKRHVAAPLRPDLRRKS